MRSVNSHLILSSTVGSIVTVSGSLKVSNGQVYTTVPATHLPTGTTQTINWNDGSSQIVSLTSSSGNVTFTLNNPQAGGSYLLEIVQSSGTTRDVVFPAAVKFPDSSTPVVTQISGAHDIVALWYNGSFYRATINQNFRDD